MFESLKIWEWYGIVWEAYHKGVPLLGVPGITLDPPDVVKNKFLQHAGDSNLTEKVTTYLLATWQVVSDRTEGLSSKLGGGNSNIFWFSPRKLGKIPILTNIFQMGWNHQLVKSSPHTSPQVHPQKVSSPRWATVFSLSDQTHRHLGICTYIVT